MQSDLIDKLLIVLMVTLLPVTIFFASNYQRKLEKERVSELEKEQMAKVTAAVVEIQTKSTSQELKSLEISHVYYATGSGSLVVKGTAPKPDQNVMVSAVLTPVSAIKNRSSSSSAKPSSALSVLGQAVDVVAIKTDEEGGFSFVKKINEKDAAIVDLRFDQDLSSATIQFDLQKKRQIL